VYSKNDSFGPLLLLYFLLRIPDSSSIRLGAAHIASFHHEAQREPCSTLMIKCKHSQELQDLRSNHKNLQLKFIQLYYGWEMFISGIRRLLVETGF
jgi:hypothetical protein